MTQGFQESAERERTRFSDREEIEQIGEYRSFNPAAALSFILGLASIFALASYMSWIVPALGLCVGALGLWLANRRESMGGRGLAWAGIFLSLLFVSMAASRFVVERRVLYREAQVIGQGWLELVKAGEDEIAHQAMIHPARRQARGFSVDEYYEMDQDAMTAKDGVFNSSPAQDIVALGPDAQIKLIKNISQDIDLKYGKLIFQTYRVEAAGKKPVDATLVIARTYKEELKRASWIIADIKHPNDF